MMVMDEVDFLVFLVFFYESEVRRTRSGTGVNSSLSRNLCRLDFFFISLQFLVHDWWIEPMGESGLLEIVLTQVIVILGR